MSQPLIEPATNDRLHVMTFNLRMDVDPAPRAWADRRPLVRQLLERERPTILGTQEGELPQLLDLRADLPGYDWIHLFRDGGSQGQAMAVFYDRQRLRLAGYDHLWLSDTPRVIGSTGWGNEITRMLTWVRFADQVSGKEFVFLNTHFDHISAPSRDRSAELVRDVVAGFDVPTIAVGDFNAATDSTPYRTLCDGGLLDSWDTAERRLSPHLQTYTAFEPEPFDGIRMDWILTTPGVRVEETAINTWTAEGAAPSDHWPVQALLRLP